MSGDRAQGTVYRGQYMTVELGYIMDESRAPGAFGSGKLYKAFKVGTNLNYRNIAPDLVKANTVTVGSEVVCYALKGRKFSVFRIVAETIGCQRAKAKSNLVYLGGRDLFMNLNDGMYEKVLVFVDRMHGVAVRGRQRTGRKRGDA